MTEKILPAGAAALCYANKVIDIAPKLTDLCGQRVGPYSLFDGMFFDSSPPNISEYSETNGILTIPFNRGVTTQQRNSSAGTLPYLSGANGFYAEFEISLSSNDPDHWPALTVMPWEHDIRNPQSDIYPGTGDPAYYERWMELDVYEGGFGAGPLHSVVDWQGTWDIKNGQYWRDYPTDTVPGAVITNNLGKLAAIDTTQIHRFGASYNPAIGRILWYIDDVQTFSAVAPTIAAKQHFYMTVGAQTHGGNVAYSLYLRRMRAYTP